MSRRSFPHICIDGDDAAHLKISTSSLARRARRRAEFTFAAIAVSPRRRSLQRPTYAVGRRKREFGFLRPAHTGADSNVVMRTASSCLHPRRDGIVADGRCNAHRVFQYGCR